FGVKDAESGAESTGERFWFVFYGIAAFLYRMLIMFTIILYIGGKFFIVGVLLAIWGVTTQIMVPIGKNLSFLFTSPKIRDNRGRAVTLSVVILCMLLLLLFVVPAPSWTRAEGVVWPSETSRVRVGVDGYVAKYLAGENSRVDRDQNIIQMEDPLLSSRLDVLQSRLKELKAQLMAAQVNDRVQTAVIREEISAVSGDLQRAQEQSDALVIKSPRDGVLVVPDGQDLPGRFLRKGELVAYVLEPSERISARVVVSQDDIGLVREETRDVEVMAAQWGSDPWPVSTWRQVPGGTDQLPTAALGSTGGGNFTIDPTDPTGRTTLERVFEIEIDLPPEFDSSYLGQRVYVKFDHGLEPVGLQMYRALRQLFLRRFSV
ncbi:MAG: peptidase M50, partial [Gammaproteobacteria bacterium]